jgi:hypothetical protein
MIFDQHWLLMIYKLLSHPYFYYFIIKFFPKFKLALFINIIIKLQLILLIYILPFYEFLVKLIKMLNLNP